MFLFFGQDKKKIPTKKFTGQSMQKTSTGKRQK